MNFWRRTFVFAAFLLATHIASAQSDSCQQRTVVVSVAESNGRPVANLTPENFSGHVGRDPVKIVSVKPNSASPRVFLVIDASGSMTGPGENWKYYMEVADWFVAGAPRGASLGLAVFTNKMIDFVPLSANTDESRAQLNKLRSRDKEIFTGKNTTALWDALDEVYTKMSPATAGDAMFVLTDGEDNASKTATKSVAEELSTSGIRVFTLSLENPGPLRPPDQGVAFSRFQDLPGRTGGISVNVSRLAYGVLMPLRMGNGKLSADGLQIGAEMTQIFNYLLLTVDLPVKPGNGLIVC